MIRSPALGELFDLLRAEGFAIGVDDHVRVGRLLALETAWREDQLRTAIRAVIAKDARQQAAFDAVWARLFAANRSVMSRQPSSPAAPEASSGQPVTRGLLLSILAGLGVGVIIGMLAWWHWSGPSAPVGSFEEADDSGPEGSGGGAPDEEAGLAQQLVKRLTAPRRHVGYLDVGALLLGGVMLAGGLAIGGIRARRRKRFLPGPWRYSPRVPAAIRPVLSRDDIADGAAHLTWQIEREVTGDLDVDRSAHATAAAGGAPVIVNRAPPSAPRCLVLEDSEGGSERWRFLYDEMLRGLAREGADVARYSFSGDPSSCTSIDGRVCCELRDLVEHCDALIVVGDGDAAFDPLEGTPAGWLRTLRHVPRRLWLNPVPKARWSRGARVIARDTPMEHAIARGLAALRIPGAERRRPERAGFPRVIERAPATSVGFAALQDHLGPCGTRAVAAVAMAGEPSIPALRWLVELLRLSLDEATWLVVVSLPWFQSGTWPEGLQARLVAWLQATDARLADEIAEATTALLVDDEPPPGSAAHLRWELCFAAARLRAGDRAGASAAIQRVGATALHAEIPRWVPGARPARAGRAVGVFVVLGAVLCAIGGARLLIPESPPPVTGSVHIESVPPNAEVYFNGARLSDGTPLTVYEIPAGSRHEIRVVLPRYKPYAETVDIPKAGGEISVAAVMQPITGKIVVDSQPGGAEIWIDGQLRGRTPVTLSDIDTSAAKKIELRLKGYQPFVSELAWPEDGQITIEPKLLRLRDSPD